jgi:hypothetical protein
MVNDMKTNKKIIIAGCAIVGVLVCLCVGYFVLKKDDSSSTVTTNVFTESTLNDYQTLTLEYTNKEIDPLTYLKDVSRSSASPASVSLKNVGSTTVTYTIDEETIECTFIVKDTQSPVITFNEDNLELDSLDGYDFNSNVQSVNDPVEGTLARFDAEPEKLTDSTDGKVYETGWYTVTVEDKTVTVHACDNHGNTTDKSYTVTVKQEATEEPEETSTPDTTTTMYSYKLVDLSGIGTASNWDEVDSSDWYYAACTYHSGHYQTVQEALQDVVDHEASIGNTVNVENEARIFCVKNSSGNVLYYQAGFEE